MTTLEAIELVRSTPAAELSAEQLAMLRALLEKTPSLYAVLGGRAAVEAFISSAESAIESAGAVAVATDPMLLESAAAAHRAAEPAAPPFWAAWPRRRVIEVGIFVALLIVGGAAFISVLLSMMNEGGTSHNAKAATATDGNSSRPGTAAGVQGSAGAQPTAQPSTTAADPGGSDELRLIEDPPDVWQGWKFAKSAGARVDKAPGWDLGNPSKPRPIYRLLSAAGGLSFDRTQVVPEGTGSIRIDCVQSVASPAGTIELLVDGKSSGTANAPPPGTSEPVLLPLTLTAGKQVALKVVYVPGGPSEQVEWRGLALCDERVEAVGTAGEPDATRPSLRLWLRADRGIKDAAGRGPLEAGFDGHIKTWEDQSARRYHLTSDGGAAPKYTAAEPMLAGKPGIVFAGAFLRHRDQRLYETPASTTFAVFTVHGLARKQRGSSAVIFETSPPSFGWHTGAYHDGRGRYGHDVTFVGPRPSPMTSKMVPMGTYALIAAARVNGRGSLIEINGQNRMFVEAVGAPSGDTLILGGGHTSPGSYGGTIAEVLVFNRALSGIEVRQVGKYLQTRYGIAGGY